MKKKLWLKNYGHYYKSAYYSPYCEDKVFISRQEYKAKKWAYNMLIPFEDLRRAILSGNTNILSLADYFDVTTQFMSKWITIYLAKSGQLINEEEMLQVSI